MTPPVGLIPAAGFGSRLGLKRSKELLTVAGPSGAREPAISWLLDSMRQAGIDRALVVVREEKLEIAERLGPRTAPRLTFVVTERTRSIPETLARAAEEVGQDEVLLGFPDVLFEPESAVSKVIEARRHLGTDVVIGLFPSSRPDKTDMVDLTHGRVTGFRIKPGPCSLEYTWLLATWGRRFSAYLQSFLERTGGRPPRGGGSSELQMSHVFAAALEDGLSVGAEIFPEGRFVDIGTPEDLELAQRGEAW